MGPSKKKMVRTFGDAFATARVEGVFMGRGSIFLVRNIVWNGPIYQKNWFASTELITDSFRIRPKNGLEKCQKFMVPNVYLWTLHDPALPCLLLPNTTDVLEHPSSGEDSDADDVDLHIPGIFPLQIGDFVSSLNSRVDPSFNCLDPRVPDFIASRIAFIASVEYITAKKMAVQSMNVEKQLVMKPDLDLMPNL